MGRATDLKHISIYLTDEAKRIIAHHARKLDYIVTTDYIRDLIERDLKAHGTHINLEVKRGKKKLS